MINTQVVGSDLEEASPVHQRSMPPPSKDSSNSPATNDMLGYQAHLMHTFQIMVACHDMVGICLNCRPGV